MEKRSRIYVAGHRGLAGSAIVRQLKSAGFGNLILRTSQELNLTRQQDVDLFFEREKPEYVFLAAARVGGILENIARPADFIRDNLLIQTHVIDSAYRAGVQKLLFLGSSCIYPRDCKQPMCEDDLLSGKLEPTNESYALAKIAGLKMCAFYAKQYGFKVISLMPPNLFGIGDNFHPESSHVLQGLMRRMHEAKLENADKVVVWGSGKPRREFMFADDLADACLWFMQHYDNPEFVNVGVGQDYAIEELAQEILDVVGFKGDLIFDTSKPDGMPQKLLDITRMQELGWKPKTRFQDGLKQTYDWFVREVYAK